VVEGDDRAVGGAAGSKRSGARHLLVNLAWKRLWKCFKR